MGRKSSYQRIRDTEVAKGLMRVSVRVGGGEGEGEGEGTGGEVGGGGERIGRIGGQGKLNGLPGFICNMVQFWMMTKSRMLHCNKWLKHNKGKKEELWYLGGSSVWTMAQFLKTEMHKRSAFQTSRCSQISRGSY